MKIAVVGCGAVGSYYGARLCQAGEEVCFLLRSDYEAVRRDGVRILSPDGALHARPRSVLDPAEVGPCEVVLVALKTTANGEFGRLVAPLVGPGTAVVTLQNGLGNEEQLAEVAGAGKVFGGLCFVCLNRIAPGVVRHSAYGQIELGEFRRPPGARAHALAEMFKRAGVDCRVVENLDRARWTKLVWNVPFNGLGVAGVAGYEAVIGGAAPEVTFRKDCLAADELLADPRWEKLVRELMAEVIRAAGALGHSIPNSLAEDRVARTRSMGAYKASTLLDFEAGKRIELESLFLEPLRRARGAGASTPRLACLCAVLEELDRVACSRSAS